MYEYSFEVIADAWEQVKTSFKNEISESSIELWFDPIKLVGCKNNLLEMEIESKVKYEIIMKSYFETLRQRFKEIISPDFEIKLTWTGHVVTAADILKSMGIRRIEDKSSSDDKSSEEDYEDDKSSSSENYDEDRSSSTKDYEEDYDDNSYSSEDYYDGKRTANGSVSREKSEGSYSSSLYTGNVRTAKNNGSDDESCSSNSRGSNSSDSRDGYESDRGSGGNRGDGYESDRAGGYDDPYARGRSGTTDADRLRSNYENGYNLSRPSHRVNYSKAPEETEEERLERENSPDFALPTYNFQYTFDNFIVGNSNKFAHAASVAVAEHPAMNYNPLFIYGPSGLGKTHLLYAITNYLKQTNPKIKIIYVKGEDFTNYMIDCISRQAMKEFRDRYRKCDVLLIDDIQFIAGKESTQEEFFHTFNSLYDEHKQIILTSDRPPRDIQRLESRLKSRFEWGLLADIQPPDLELRIAIIKAKAESVKLYLDNETLIYLAENLRSNVRQIEGAIKKLGAITFLSGKPITTEDAARCVSELLGDDEPVTVTVDKIFTVVYKKYNVPKEEILSTKRNKNIAFARHVSIYLIREITGMSLPSIGTVFGRDHTTIMSSIDAVNKKLASDPMFAVELKELKKQLTS